jgi:hypothetical protein
MEAYGCSGRIGRRHRRLILDHLAVTTFDDEAEARFRPWLVEELLPREPSPSALEREVCGWFAPTQPGLSPLRRPLHGALRGPA